MPTRTITKVSFCARLGRSGLPLMLTVGAVLALLAGVLLLVQPAAASLPEPGTETIGAAPQQASGDYDADDDGLIEVANLAQLDAIRHDLDGDGSPTPANPDTYAAAFPGAAAGMGCPELSGCTGYELVSNLDFDTNGNGRTDSGASVSLYPRARVMV